MSADDGINGVELWKSDGTEAGTVMVKDIDLGWRPPSGPTELTDVNGTLFFNVNNDVTTGGSCGNPTAPRPARSWSRR